MAYVRTAEHTRKISEANRGKSPSLETREKMRAAKLGRKLSPEHATKIGAANKGRGTLFEILGMTSDDPHYDKYFNCLE